MHESTYPLRQQPPILKTALNILSRYNVVVMQSFCSVLQPMFIAPNIYTYLCRTATSVTPEGMVPLMEAPASMSLCEDWGQCMLTVVQKNKASPCFSISSKRILEYWIWCMGQGLIAPALSQSGEALFILLPYQMQLVGTSRGAFHLWTPSLWNSSFMKCSWQPAL